LEGFAPSNTSNSELIPQTPDQLPDFDIVLVMGENLRLLTVLIGVKPAPHRQYGIHLLMAEWFPGFC
jgi:hypothetical protein